MSAEVQKSLRIDPEHTASLTWRAQGRRETRTLLYELGFDVYDDILDAMHKPVYYCGYLHGLKKEQELNKRAERLTVEIEQCNDKYDDLMGELEEVRLALHESEKNAIIDAADADKWKRLYEKERERANHLEQANEELLAGVGEPEKYIGQKEKITKLNREERDKKIRECLDLGMTNRDIQKVTGASAGTISTICKMRNAEKGEQEAS